MPKYISDPKEFVKTLRKIIEQREEKPKNANKTNEESNNKEDKKSLNHSVVKFKNSIIIRNNNKT